MVEKEYNKKYKKWVDGDTFAYKITAEGEYKNRYLILIKYVNENWEKYPSTFTFRAKITKDDQLPTTKEELEALEYVQIGFIFYCDRFLPFSGLTSIDEQIKEKSKIKYYPDKNGYLNIYIFELYFGRKYIKLLNNFIYLGNFNLKTPKGEYIPFVIHNCPLYSFLDRLENDLITKYEDYNLRKNIWYTKEYLEKARPWDESIDIKIMREVEKKMASLTEEEIIKYSKPKRDTLTYVGGEDKDPYKSKKNKKK